MKLLCSSDWHCDTVTAGVDRLPELSAVVDAMHQVVREEGIDAVLVGGDYYDPGSIWEARWARFTYRALHRFGRCLAIPGNHDVVDAAEPLSTLSPLAAIPHKELVIVELPTAWGFVSINGSGSCVVLALPYVSRQVERSEAYRKAYDEAFEAARKASKHQPVVVLTHLMFEGMHPGSEETMARGRDVPFPVSDVELVEPRLVLAGHYHDRQTIKRGKLEVEIIGAPLALTFGDREGPRGFLVVEV